MPTRPGFSKAALAELDAAKIVGVRAGTEHDFTGVWTVLVRGRVFARSWNDKPTGWYRAFLAEPLGSMQPYRGRELRVRAKPVRHETLLAAIDAAYAEKYHTPASRKWVRGLVQPRRRQTTMEFVPAVKRRTKN